MFGDPTGHYSDGLATTLVTMGLLSGLFAVYAGMVRNGKNMPEYLRNAADTYQSNILNVPVTPVIIEPKGSVNGKKWAPMYEIALKEAQLFWKNHAGISISWNDFLVDNSGQFNEVNIGYTDGNTRSALEKFYEANGSHPVILIGVNFHDSAGKGTMGYTPGNDEGVLTMAGARSQTIAHELGHLFLGSGDHENNVWNIMSEGGARENVNADIKDLILNQEQVDSARRTVSRLGWIKP